MSEDISLDLEATESVERRQMTCFKLTTEENSSKSNDNRATVEQVIDEMKSYNQWKLGTFILTLILSILGGWDVISDEMLGAQYLRDQKPVFGILTILLTFIPGIKFYRYKKVMVKDKFNTAWFFACLFLISKVTFILYIITNNISCL